MSDKELDEILQEIKMRSDSNSDAAESESAILEEDNTDNSSVNDSKSFHIEALPKKETISHSEIHSIIQEDIKELKKKNTVENKENPVVVNLEDESEDIQSEVESNETEEMFNITAEPYADYKSDETFYNAEDSEINKKAKASKKKKVIIIVIAVILVLAAATGAALHFGSFYKKSDEPTARPEITQAEPSTEPVAAGPLNPLTGETGYSESALNQRPVAVVVENEYSTESVRPQWGLADADIVLEGESEFSTRLLLFWSDYTKVPSMVGPTRSARPPFIRFSQLFDSVFIHAGLSHSKGNYEGADTVFKNENVDHINGLAESMSGKYFGRNYNRTSTVEHTAYLNGENLPELLKNHKINTELNADKFSVLLFNDEAQPLSDTKAETVSFNWSDVYSSGKCPKTAKFTYDADAQKYVTTDFDSKYGTSKVNFENLIFLLDETEYVVKQNYKGKGKSETYCDYKLSGGKGTVLSHGTAVEITWGVKNSKLWMKTADGKDLVLNPGKSYIGYGSSNHGGAVKLNPGNDTKN